MAEQPPSYNESSKMAEAGYPPQTYQAAAGGQPPPPGQPAYPPAGGQPAGGGPGYPPQGQPGYPPQGQPGYPPQPSGTTVVVTQPPTTTVVMQTFRNAPVQCMCPNCHSNVITELTYETGTVTWLVCLGLALVGCWLGCCLIPFCVNDLQDVVHRCPSCKAVVGRYNRM